MGGKKKSWWRRLVDRLASFIFSGTKIVRSKKSSSRVLRTPKTSQKSEVKSRKKSVGSMPRVDRSRAVAEKTDVLAKKSFIRFKEHAPNKVIPGESLLTRHEENPILEPTDNIWESKAVFNPAAAEKDGKIHLIYRAIGDQDVSMLGYASSRDGVTIEDRSEEPVYSIDDHVTMRDESRAMTPRRISYDSGGGWSGGCEDPRMVIVDDDAYVFYTAFDGWNSIRMACASIAVEDLEQHRWNWKKRLFLSPSKFSSKNWVMFPQKINGKFAILHTISPKIDIVYVDDLSELETHPAFPEDTYVKVKRKDVWDTWVRGAGPPPIKTKEGWLLFYHAMDQSDPNRYKLGAMLLDLKHPEKVLYRSTRPILEPDRCYENEGHKAGVVYCCGAVVMRDELFVYYGGADTVTCVAVANLEHFLHDLKTTGAPVFEGAHIPPKPTYAKRKTISKKSRPVAKSRT